MPYLLLLLAPVCPPTAAAILVFPAKEKNFDIPLFLWYDDEPLNYARFFKFYECGNRIRKSKSDAPL